MHLCIMKVLKVIFVVVTLFFFASCSDLNGTDSIKNNNAKNEISYAKTIELFEDSLGCKVHIYNPDTKITTRYYLAKKKYKHT